jgi:hypothetical protein
MELIRDTSFALMWIGLVTLLLFWFGVRREVNKAVKFLADRMTEQNRHVNPLLESIRDEVPKGNPYREKYMDPNCERPLPPVFLHEEKEPLLLSDWVLGSACPYCNTETYQDDPTEPAVRPVDGATVERPYLTWECTYCASVWNTPPKKPHPVHPSYTVDLGNKTGTEALAVVQNMPRPRGPRPISE